MSGLGKLTQWLQAGFLFCSAANAHALDLTVAGGPNHYSVAISEAGVDAGPIGWTAGLMLAQEFRPGLGIMGGPVFMRRNLRTTDPESSAVGEVFPTTYWVQFPLLARYKPRPWLQFAAGGYHARGLSTSCTTRRAAPSPGQDVLSCRDPGFRGFGMRSSEWGLLVTAGTSVSLGEVGDNQLRAVLDVQRTWGLTNLLIEEGAPAAKSREFRMMAGLQLSLGSVDRPSKPDLGRVIPR